MKIEKFENIIVWQKSIELAKIVYIKFRECKDFGFRDQTQRAVVSISNNIAEGFEKGTNKDFKKFLFIAKGSCGEVRSMMYLAIELGYLDKETFDEIYKRTIEISKMLSGFIKKLTF